MGDTQVEAAFVAQHAVFGCELEADWMATGPVIAAPFNRGAGDRPESYAARSEVCGESVESSGGAPLLTAGPSGAVHLQVTPPFPRNVLALGGELKNTVCTGERDGAWMSASHGDLTESRSYRAFLDTIGSFHRRRRNQTEVIAHDLHPSYLSTRHARRLPPRQVAVQHHHAHAVSCAADAGVALPVIGIVCDGAGYGTDGAIWGGEVLLCRADSFERLAHLDYFGLPGGDLAATHTWRPALSILRETLPGQWRSLRLPAFDAVTRAERELVARQLDTGLNSPKTSSLGRLFDAVAFLVGIRAFNEYEGQAASELQAVAGDGRAEPYSFRLEDGVDAAQIDWRPMFLELVGDVKDGVDASTVSRRFHQTIVAMFEAAALRAAQEAAVDRVVLSGGCFFNDILRGHLAERLAAQGMTVGVHNRVSPGDGGLSLGQAVVGSAIAAKRSGAVDGA